MKVTIFGLAQKSFIKDGKTIEYYRAYGYYDTKKEGYYGSEFGEFKIEQNTYDSMVHLYNSRGIFTCELEFNMYGQVAEWVSYD